MAKKTLKKKVKKVSKKSPKKAKKVSKKLVKKVVRKVIKKAVKKPIKKVMPIKVAPPKPAGKVVGVIAHFYDQISVAVVEVKSDIHVGDIVEISGHDQRFTQKIISMQVEHTPISVAKKGQIIGMKVVKPVKEKDLMYKK